MYALVAACGSKFMVVYIIEAMDEVSLLVARQYEAYSYPPPFDDIADKIAQGYVQAGDPSLYSPLLWPEGRPGEHLNILVAGCGTVQAAVIAFTNRNCTVTGIDLSEASLAHHRFLQERHGLANLRLFQGELTEVGQTGARYDLIFCSGVLHHLADPDAGLRALRDVLTPRGAMLLMVYGQNFRTGVYMMQDVFRRLGVAQDAESIAFARRTLTHLPQKHFVHCYVKDTGELQHDAAFVDTFLHPRDRAYTVPQVLDFLERNGLRFQCWADNRHYHPEGVLPPDAQELIDRIAALPEREQWAVVENITLAIGTHIFVACRPERAQPHLQVDFSTPDWEDLVPHFVPGLQSKRSDAPPGQPDFVRNGWFFSLGPHENLLMGGVNGVRPIREILAQPALAGHTKAARDAFGREFFRVMWRLGHLMYTRARP
jgi:SAM-dependent methyltransferase